VLPNGTDGFTPAAACGTVSAPGNSYEENRIVKKRLSYIAAGVLVLSVGVYLSTKLWAQTPTAPQAPRAQTRIGLLNVGYVIMNYKKVETFKNEMKAYYTSCDDTMKKKSQELEARKKQLTDPTLTAQQDAIKKEITKLQREMEDLNAEVKKKMNEQGDQQTVIIYREMKDAASRYAVAHGLDMVMTYIDAVNEADFFNPMNVIGKMQQRACTPLYYDPSMDISKDIVIMLNASYPASATPASATTPAASH
jgi:Skp family chaperone for outer membrane proteins